MSRARHALMSLALASLALAAASPAARAQTANSLLPHPRLGLYGGSKADGFPFVRLDQTINQALLDSVARYDTVVLPASPFTEYDPQVLAGLRARHPGIRLLAYVQADYAYPSNSTDSLVHIPTRHFHLVRDLGAYLYDRAGNLFHDADINLARTDATGRYYVSETLADFFASAVWGTGLWDGLFFDRFCSGILWNQQPGESLDVARAGFSNPAAFDSAWHAGSDALAARLRKDLGSAPLIVGNCGQSTQYAWLNGWMHEDFPNQNGVGWNPNMFRNPGGYTVDEASFRAPQSDWLVAWPQDLAHPFNTDALRRVRFTLGTASLLDGFGTFNPPNCDATTGYLDWWYDEYAVSLATGRSTGLLSDTGWLGAAAGPYTSFPTLGPVDATALNPGFEIDLSGWTFATTVGSTLTRDTTNPAVGAASARIHVAAPGTGWTSTRVTTNGYLTLAKGDAYRVSFWMRAAASRGVVVALMNAFDGSVILTRNVYPGTAWQHYDVDLVAPDNLVALLQFRCGGTAVDTWLDDVHFTQSDITLYRRDFTHGIVLVNPTAIPLTVVLDQPYRRIYGNLDHTVNDGSENTQATVPPNDAVFLIRSSSLVDVGGGPPGAAAGAPAGFAFVACAPNPLARGARLVGQLALPRAGEFALAVFDVAGRRVRGLGTSAGRAGANLVLWDGRGDDGRFLPRGLYFVQARFEGRAVAARVVLE